MIEHGNLKLFNDDCMNVMKEYPEFSSGYEVEVGGLEITFTKYKKITK